MEKRVQIDDIIEITDDELPLNLREKDDKLENGERDLKVLKIYYEISCAIYIKFIETFRITEKETIQSCDACKACS